MSRHEFENSKGLKVVFGFDHPMSEYFLDVTDPKIEVEEDFDDSNVVCRKSSYGLCSYTGEHHSNSQMFEAMQEHEVPQWALNCVAMDMPID